MKTLFQKIKNGLNKTRSLFAQPLKKCLDSSVRVEDEDFEALETQLILADVGVRTAQAIVEEIKRAIKKNKNANPQVLHDLLKQYLYEQLKGAEKVETEALEVSPRVILVVGVNGSGKTTTIGKLAYFFKQQGKKVMLAAGDTFRAAAVSQLQHWGKENDIPVIAQPAGADSASVIFDAVKSAQAKKVDILIADTAGRLHTQTHLMEELKKIKRVVAKLEATAPQDIWLVLDAQQGQNALQQAKIFYEALGVTGIILTKLDGTAKGGIIFSIAEQLKMPIYFLGLGEGVLDLQPFSAMAFISALLEE